MDYKYRQEHLKEMQNWSLDRKIEHAKKRINEFYDSVGGKVYVAFSGGKDSAALLHLVRSMYPDVVAVFSNTTNEYHEILEFVRTIENCVTVNPKMTFNETVKEYGFPLVSKMTAEKIYRIKQDKDRKNNVTKLYLTGINSKGKHSPTMKLANKWFPLIEENFNITNKCCDILKKEPLNRFAKENDLYPIIGTQASESESRAASWITTGCNVFGSKPQSKPFSIWTEEDIWEYIRMNNIPYSTIYDDVEVNGMLVSGEKRTGCAYCAFGAHLEKGTNRFQRLSIRKPKQYEKMMSLTNNGIKFEDALHKIGVKTRVETLF